MLTPYGNNSYYMQPYGQAATPAQYGGGIPQQPQQTLPAPLPPQFSQLQQHPHYNSYYMQPYGQAATPAIPAQYGSGLPQQAPQTLPAPPQPQFSQLQQYPHHNSYYMQQPYGQVAIPATPAQYGGGLPPQPLQSSRPLPMPQPESYLPSADIVQAFAKTAQFGMPSMSAPTFQNTSLLNTVAKVDKVNTKVNKGKRKEPTDDEDDNAPPSMQPKKKPKLEQTSQVQNGAGSGAGAGAGTSEASLISMDLSDEPASKASMSNYDKLRLHDVQYCIVEVMDLWEDNDKRKELLKSNRAISILRNHLEGRKKQYPTYWAELKAEIEQKLDKNNKNYKAIMNQLPNASYSRNKPEPMTQADLHRVSLAALAATKGSVTKALNQRIDWGENSKVCPDRKDPTFVANKWSLVLKKKPEVKELLNAIAKKIKGWESDKITFAALAALDPVLTPPSVGAGAGAGSNTGSSEQISEIIIPYGNSKPKNKLKHLEPKKVTNKKVLDKADLAINKPALAKAFEDFESPNAPVLTPSGGGAGAGAGAGAKAGISEERSPLYWGGMPQQPLLQQPVPPPPQFSQLQQRPHYNSYYTQPYGQAAIPATSAQYGGGIPQQSLQPPYQPSADVVQAFAKTAQFGMPPMPAPTFQDTPFLNTVAKVDKVNTKVKKGKGKEPTDDEDDKASQKKQPKKKPKLEQTHQAQNGAEVGVGAKSGAPEVDNSKASYARNKPQPTTQAHLHRVALAALASTEGDVKEALKPHGYIRWEENKKVCPDKKDREFVKNTWSQIKALAESKKLLKAIAKKIKGWEPEKITFAALADLDPVLTPPSVGAGSGAGSNTGASKQIPEIIIPYGISKSLPKPKKKTDKKVVDKTRQSIKKPALPKASEDYVSSDAPLFTPGGTGAGAGAGSGSIAGISEVIPLQNWTDLPPLPQVAPVPNYEDVFPMPSFEFDGENDPLASQNPEDWGLPPDIHSEQQFPEQMQTVEPIPSLDSNPDSGYVPGAGAGAGASVSQVPFNEFVWQ